LERLFNDVEEALASIARSVGGVEEVTVSEPSLQHGFKSPRIFVWIRDGEMRDITIGGRRIHSWRFEYVIDAVSGDSARAYSQAKRIMWLETQSPLDLRGLRLHPRRSMATESTWSWRC